ncbi:MAG: hypothetical protein ABIN89_13570 [Chitinophagaceae bacterium]
MKNVTLSIILLLAGTSTRPQAMQEWFNQKATQKKYLIQQIAALQVYIEYLKKGYDVANKGLTTIQNLKRSHLILDTTFFNSLKSVNPRIKNYTKVVEIISLNFQIVQQYKATISFTKGSGNFNNNEVDHIAECLGNLVNYSASILDNLINVITPAKLEMSDDQRLNRIDHLYDEMQENYLLINEFHEDAKVLSVQRAKESEDVRNVRAIYGK